MSISHRTILAGATLALGLLSPALLSQGGTWTKQAPIPMWYDVAAIAPVSADEAWVAGSPMLGDVGQLAHTTDAGATWTVIDTPRQVHAVCFTDPMHGWAAGNAFMHTTDGGQTWIQDNDWGTIEDLFFLDNLHGWACGNGSVNYWTVDGGLHWNGVSAPGGWTVGSIFFLDLLRGWSVNIGGQVCRSTDGGKSWTLISTVPGNNLQTIQFFNAQEGWAGGGGAFYHTLNGGLNWTKATVPPGTWAYSVRFFDSQLGIAVGESGNVVRTTNGGQTWTTVQPVGSAQRLWDVEFASADAVFASGDAGTIARSTDGGLTWNSIQSGGAAVTHGFDSLDAQHAWAGQDGGEMVWTTNGGAQWVRSLVSGFDAYGHVLAVAMADASTGWAAGWNDVFPFGSRGVLSRSTDGGHTWQTQLQVTDFAFMGLEAIDAQTAFAVGSFEFAGGGLVLRTQNGGATWQDVTPPTGGFRDVVFLDATTGWVVGSSISKTTDGGTSWTKQYGTEASELADISFADEQNGWAVGYSNLVLHTTDGGQHWTPQNVGAPPLTAVTGITAVSPTTAWIAGWYGFVARTTDGGQTWQPESVPGAAGVDLEDLEFTGPDIGWVGGNIGIWHRGLPGWTDLGLGLAGQQGVPSLAGSGLPAGGSPITLTLSKALSSSLAHLVMGLSLLDAPFKGGVLVPHPDQLVLALPTGAAGSIALTGTLPAGVPAGVDLYFQMWIEDGTAVHGLSASNGLRGETQ